MLRYAPMLAGVLAAPTMLSAQTPSLRPFTGCWSNASDPSLPPLPVAARVLCIVPGANSASLDLLAVRGDSVVERTTLAASGGAERVARDGCRGTRVVRPSPREARLYVTESLTCDDSIAVRGTEVWDVAGPAELVQVRGWTREGAAGAAGAFVGDARLARWRALADTEPLPAEVRARLGAQERGRAFARELVLARVTADAIVEVSQATDASVTRAWLYARGHEASVRVTGESLRALKRRGVPGAVTDMLVALANPEVFRFGAQGEIAAVPPAPDRDGRLPRSAWGPNAMGSAMGWGGWGPGVMCPIGWGHCAWDPWMMFGLGFPSVGAWASPFGPWWNGMRWNGFGGGGWTGWGGPVIGWGGGAFVPVYVGNEPRPAGGVADRRAGYTRRAPSDGSAPAAPAAPRPTTQATGGGGNSGGGSSGSSGSSGGGGRRVAVPKPPTS